MYAGAAILLSIDSRRLRHRQSPISQIVTSETTPGSKTKPRSAKRARRLWDSSVLPKLGKRKVADIQRADVAQLPTDMTGRPALANKVISLLSKAFNLAEVWGWRPEGTN